MKISEFLQDLFEKTGPTFGGNVISDDYMLTPEMLKIPQIKEGLLKCEEFENTKELIIMDGPRQEIEIEGQKAGMKPTSTMKLIEGIKFKEKVYLYSIFLTPAIYEPSDFIKPIKDDVCITPILYTPGDFVPMKAISVFFSPESHQDANSKINEKAEQEFKESLIEKFKKALDNPKEYRVKEKKAIMIRGCISESIELRKEKEIDYKLLDKSIRDFIQITPTLKGQYVEL